MKLYLMLYALTLGIGGCGISKQIEKGVDIALRSQMEPRIAVTKFLAESTASIFELDSVRQNTSIFIRSLNTNFSDTKHSFDFNVDSITVKIIKDTIVFSKISFPKRNPYLQSDTIDVKVTCRYFLRDSLVNSAEKCLLSNYVIYRDSSVVQKSKYAPCAKA